MPATLDVRQVSKRFGRTVALCGVSFHVRRGEVLGLLGPNGAGKTTLLEGLAGVLPLDAGGLHADGRPLHGDTRRTLLFYVPDGIAPWPAQPVRWLLDYVAGVFGVTADRRALVVERLSLQPLLPQRLGALSKGQHKRVLLATGLLAPAPVLLIDEPFDGLDVRQTREVAAVLRAEAASGRTLVISVHQIADAARFCDRFVLLSSGRACGEGTLPELAAMAAARAGSAPLHHLEDVFLALT